MTLLSALYLTTPLHSTLPNQSMRMTLVIVVILLVVIAQGEFISARFQNRFIKAALQSPLTVLFVSLAAGVVSAITPLGDLLPALVVSVVFPAVSVAEILAMLAAQSFPLSISLALKAGTAVFVAGAISLLGIFVITWSGNVVASHRAHDEERQSAGSDFKHRHAYRFVLYSGIAMLTAGLLLLLLNTPLRSESDLDELMPGAENTGVSPGSVTGALAALLAPFVIMASGQKRWPVYIYLGISSFIVAIVTLHFLGVGIWVAIASVVCVLLLGVIIGFQ